MAALDFDVLRTLEHLRVLFLGGVELHVRSLRYELHASSVVELEDGFEHMEIFLCR